MRDDFDRRYERACFINNILKERAEAARQAAQETGFSIDIREAEEHGLPGRVGVWTHDSGRDHEPFWKRYNELIQQIKSE